MTGKRIYLDHAATTPTDEGVVREMLPYFSMCFGNASSLHKRGRDAVAAVDNSRETIARAIGASPSEIYFVSGGTEADHWAIRGLAKANADKGKHIVASSIEHPALLGALKKLQAEGFEITYLPVDDKGFVSLRDVENALREDTVLLSVMMVNNEVGSIQPIRDIARVAHERGVLFHTDAVQAMGVIPVNVADLGVDAMSFSSHKFYGPKGVGALYLRKGVKIDSIFLGGEQERKLRGGTYNTPAIVGMAAALDLAVRKIPETAAHLAALKKRFVEKIVCELVSLNGGEPAHPGIVNLCFSGVRNDDLLSALDREGVEASAGSACSSGSTELSHVLTAMGRSESEIRSSVRFSFGRENTLEEVDRAATVINDILTRLRRDADLFLQGASPKKNI